VKICRRPLTVVSDRRQGRREKEAMRGKVGKIRNRGRKEKKKKEKKKEKERKK